jgi:hypothetical protein
MRSTWAVSGKYLGLAVLAFVAVAWAAEAYEKSLWRDVP